MITTEITKMLILSLGGSLLLLAGNGWSMIFGTRRRWLASFFLFAIAIGSASILAVDLLDESQFRFSGSTQMLSKLGCLLLMFAIAWVSIRILDLHESAYYLRRSKTAWAVTLIALAMAGWSYHRFQVRNSNHIDFGLLTAVPGVIEPEEELHGLTDEGRNIRLYHFDSEDDAFEAFASSADHRFANFESALILRESADKHANCHGWVFTNGQFLLRGDDIDKILEDNQYQETNDPQSGDIVIYRDELQWIRHTGLVQGVLSDGTIITESKWGVDSRFLHRPEDQPYSKLFKFYHTDRPSHCILVEHAKQDSDG